MKSVVVDDPVQQHFDRLLQRKARFETGLVLGTAWTIVCCLLSDVCCLMSAVCCLLFLSTF
jgi:hypothetical protein